MRLRQDFIFLFHSPVTKASFILSIQLNVAIPNTFSYHRILHQPSSIWHVRTIFRKTNICNLLICTRSIFGKFCVRTKSMIPYLTKLFSSVIFHFLGFLTMKYLLDIAISIKVFIHFKGGLLFINGYIHVQKIRL